MNGHCAIGWAGWVYWPGTGLLDIESGKHKEKLPGSESCGVGPLGVQMRLKDPTVEKLESQVNLRWGIGKMTFKIFSNSESWRLLYNYLKNQQSPLQTGVLPAPALCCYEQELTGYRAGAASVNTCKTHPLSSNNDINNSSLHIRQDCISLESVRIWKEVSKCTLATLVHCYSC